MLSLDHVSVSYGALQVLSDVSLRVNPGSWLMVAGPNGAGKSTLLNAVSGSAPYTGQIRVNGKDLKNQKPRETARFMGMLMQNHSVGYAFTVEEIVAMGRYPWNEGLFRRSDNRRYIDDALEKTGLTALKDQSVTTLSGGELQRCFLAQLLCQNTRIMLLDEPTNHLDLIYQKQVFDLIQKWLRDTGGAVVSVVHDLSLARLYGTEALLLDRGRTVALGPIEEALSPAHLQQVYGMDVREWFRQLGELWA
ncbi:MAG: ABC transporter ATP-binding protein [Abditibacteriota bacterium]|nr:ABC transporter ATP-binding protein [Abditibacteriota bacterium]